MYSVSDLLLLLLLILKGEGRGWGPRRVLGIFAVGVFFVLSKCLAGTLLLLAG